MLKKQTIPYQYCGFNGLGFKTFSKQREGFRMKFVGFISRTFLLISVGLAVSNAGANYDRAVDVYMKGLAACNEANQLRQSNLPAAKKKLETYRRYLDQATRIDGSILNSSVREMDKNISFCNRVIDNIGRAEAMPTLKQAFTHCKQAKQHYKAKEFNQAESALSKYTSRKNKALSMSSSLTDVFMLAHRMKACDRLITRVSARRQNVADEQSSIKKALATAQTINNECRQIAAFTGSKKFNIEQLDNANARLEKWVTRTKKNAPSDTLVSYMNSHKELPETAALNAQLKSQRDCKHEVTEHIRAMMQERRNAIATIDRGHAMLKESLGLCQEATTLANKNSIDAASERYKDSASLKKQASASSILKFVKDNPRWNKSAAYNSLLIDTSQCHNAVSSRIQTLKAERQKALAQKPIDAARRAAEAKRIAAQKAAEARRKAQERAAAAAEQRRQQQAERAAAKAADERRRAAKAAKARELREERQRAAAIARAKAAAEAKAKAEAAARRAEAQRIAEKKRASSKAKRKANDDWTDDAFFDGDIDDADFSNFDDISDATIERKTGRASLTERATRSLRTNKGTIGSSTADDSIFDDDFDDFEDTGSSSPKKSWTELVR